MTNDDSMSVVCTPSYLRAGIALCGAVGVPILVVVVLYTKGYTVLDYPSLLLDGSLSIIRQIAMWIGFVLLLCWYVPAAILALRSPNYIAVDDDFLYLPGRVKIPLDDITQVLVRKEFVHRVIKVFRPSDTARTIVTFADCNVDQIRERLRADPRIAPFVS